MDAILLLGLATIIATAHAQTDCQGGQLTTAIRSDIIFFQNLRRSLVSRGLWGLGPRGRNIYRLSYNCSLEASAQAVASVCGPTFGSNPTTLGFTGENLYLRPGGTAHLAFFRAAAVTWWAQAAHNQILRFNLNYTSAAEAMGIGNYAQVAWGSTTLVGCGFARCSNTDSRYVCHYQTGKTVNALVYETGSGCTTNADCTTFPASTCDPTLQLCHKPDGLDPNPATTTPASATTASPLDCGGSSVMTIGTRNSIVNQHNALRRLIARVQPIMGQFRRGSNAMFTMRYDCGLESRAQREADSNALCTAAAAPDPPNRGQNVFVSARAFTGAGALFVEANAAWRMQVNTFNQEMNIGAPPNLLPAVGYFTQMVFWRTTAVGCGVGRCEANKNIFVCRYRVPRPDANAKAYPLASFNGCTTRDCQRGYSNATCNATSALCEI